MELSKNFEPTAIETKWYQHWLSKGYFNSTGNAGMAKGGSGDALTGMITSFLAQGYKPWEAAVLSAYIHGLAGDFAATWFSKQSMIASDIIDCIGQAILSVGRNENAASK